MMKTAKRTALLTAAVLCLTGCSSRPQQPEPEPAATTADTAAFTAPKTTSAPVSSETQKETTQPAPAQFSYNPHLYSPKIAELIPQEYWDSLYNLCDALRKGKSAFACASLAAYDWATDGVTLGNLLPAACMMINVEIPDPASRFADGTGRIYYRTSPEEFLTREAEFEETVTEILNTYLEPDDTAFERCLKLYDYMESNFTYQSVPEDSIDGSQYYALMHQSGVCVDLSGAYAFLLRQAGIDALVFNIFEPEMCHAWVYAVLNGQGYHIDPTWALKSGDEPLALDYFMMTDEHRRTDGCPLNDVGISLLPGFFANNSELTFPANDDRYETGYYTEFQELDEVHKILRYTDLYGERCEIRYE